MRTDSELAAHGEAITVVANLNALVDATGSYYGVRFCPIKAKATHDPAALIGKLFSMPRAAPGMPKGMIVLNRPCIGPYPNGARRSSNSATDRTRLVKLDQLDPS